MATDINAADVAVGAAVLLHPHPDYGGNRHHPFIDGLFRRLPEVSVSAVRFDFATSSPAEARGQVLDGIESATAGGPHLPVVLVGYSFGAAIGAMVDAPELVGWYLLAPPSAMLGDAVIGADLRPKSIQVPEHDQFSTTASIEQATSGWRSTVVETVVGIDHFLGDVRPIVERAVDWIGSLLSAPAGGSRGRDR
ncbi:MAG TPA: hypothetical protein VG435_14475 [Acidimicrobiales bacterium]|jgi:hypothetical protein|nr:hypothetical protein [Acidimicrobiales bacterium]